MVEISVKLHGAKELRDALAKLPSEMGERVLRRATFKGANIIKDAYSENMPVRTGKTKKSIRARLDSKPIETVALYHIGAGHFVAKFVEFGTKFMPAQHPLQEAFDEKSKEAVDVVQKELAAGIKRAVAKLAKRGER